MRVPSKIRVHGPDHTVSGRVTLYLERGPCAVALVITPGLRKRSNEDAGGWERFDRRSFYAVADGHFGGGSAVIAVDACLLLLSSRLIRKDHFEPQKFRKCFAEALAVVEARILQQEGTVSSETTLLALAAGWGRFLWGSFGDSRLYAVGPSLRKQVNRTDSIYLGSAARQASDLARRMACGELRGLSGQRRFSRLMLSTDGVPLSGGPTIDEWSTAGICDILSDAADASAAAAKLAAAALQRGGADNICAIVLDTPWITEK